jgi:hypothetical protein
MQVKEAMADMNPSVIVRNQAAKIRQPPTNR